MVEHESFDNWIISEEMVLAGLSENAKTLFAELTQFEWSCLILHFLHSHSTTSLTADDVAYHLAKPIEAIERDLTTLAQLRLVQTTRVAGVTFYCLTHEPSRRKLVHELCAWQDSWETRVRAIVLMIWGNGASATYIAPARMREFHSAFHAAKGLTPAHAPILPPTLEREVKWTKPF